MDPPSCHTHPVPAPGVDSLTCKAAWDLIHESFSYLNSVGTKPFIERQVFREHPKRLGDFSETLEVRVGKRLIIVDIEFMLEKGLRIKILDGKERILQDEWFTQRSQYEKQLSTCFLV
jgi:hypothetical protein